MSDAIRRLRDRLRRIPSPSVQALTDQLTDDLSGPALAVLLEAIARAADQESAR